MKRRILWTMLLIMVAVAPALADAPALTAIQSAPTLSNPYLEFDLFIFEQSGNCSYWDSSKNFTVQIEDANGDIKHIAYLNELRAPVTSQTSSTFITDVYNLKKDGFAATPYDNDSRDKYGVYVDHLFIKRVNGHDQYWAKIKLFSLNDMEARYIKRVQVYGYHVGDGGGLTLVNGSTYNENMCFTVDRLHYQARDFLKSNNCPTGGKIEFGSSHTMRYVNNSIPNVGNGSCWEFVASDGSKDVKRQRLSSGANSIDNLTWEVSSNKTKQSIIIWAELKNYQYTIGSKTYTMNMSNGVKVNNFYASLNYPENLSASYSMWDRTVTLSWSNNQNDNSQQDGAWVVYKTLGNSTTKLGTTGSRTSSGTLSYTVPKEQLEYDKNYTFTVAFVPNGWPDSSPTPDIQQSKSLTTNRLIGNTSVSTSTTKTTTTGGGSKTVVTVTWKFNSLHVKDADQNQTKFIVERRIPKQSGTQDPWVQLGDPINLTDANTQEMSCTDEDVSSCQTFEYRVRCETMGKSFDLGTKAGSQIESSKVTDLYATKGAHTNVVKLTWKVDQAGAAATKFLVKRRLIPREGTDTSKEEWKKIYETEGTAGTYFYDDNSAATGSYYEYKVMAYELCGEGDDQQYTLSNEMTDCGYCLTTGTVSGRITFGSGMAVSGARVQLTKATDTSGDKDQQFYSAQFKGASNGITIPVDLPKNDTPGALDATIFRGAFTIGMWMRCDSILQQSNNSVIELRSRNGNNNNKLIALGMTNAGNLLFNINNADQSEKMDVHKRYVGHWSYLVLTCDVKSNYEIILIEEDGTVTRKTYARPSDSMLKGDDYYPANLKFGTNLVGNLDEIRVWNKKLTDEEIETTRDRVLSGSEEGLKLYWPLDEGINRVFDVSKTGGVSNENHGTMDSGVSSSTDWPGERNISLYGLTDDLGNYTIRGIPFSGEGINYMVQPVLGVHSFSPERASRMISANSLVHSGVDFTDVSSFNVSGKVFFSGTNIPVEGCSFYVDGTICAKDGDIISSAEDGSYTISVPIGDHFIQVKKDGHEFVGNGRYPDDPNNVGPKKTFVEDLHDLNFMDTTLVVLAGRVVGGDADADKTIGFKQSENNIGKVAFTLTLPNTNYILNAIKDEGGVTFSANEDKVEVPSSKPDTIQSHSYRGGRENPNTIFIETDSLTGEFSALVPPLEYDVSVMKTVNGGLQVAGTDHIDLSNPLIEYTDTLEGTNKTFSYNYKLSKIYHSTPSFIVEQVDNTTKTPEDGFGIESFTIEGDQEPLEVYTVGTNGEVTYNYGANGGAPLFIMEDPYTYHLMAYEEYENKDKPTSDPNRKTRQALAGTVVTISNALSSDQKVLNTARTEDGVTYKAGDVYDLEENQLQLDDNGEAYYTWNAGLPNITEPFTRTITMAYSVGSTNDTWTQAGIILGDLPTGTNFVTAGPDCVQMILRDPPGTGSHTEWTEGTITTKYTLNGSQYTTDNTISTSTRLGTKITNVVGLVGIGTITDTQLKNELEVGARVVGEGENSKSVTVSTTATRTISTSSEPDYVGSVGDVFIGTATNILFGKSFIVTLKRNETGAELVCDNALSTGLTFETAFAYTQWHVENVLLPNFAMLRDQWLVHVNSDEELRNYNNATDHPVYVTRKTPENNDWAQAGTYVMVRPSDPALAGVSYGDTINWYNEQIRVWEGYLAQNEQEKVEAFDARTDRLLENVSFDSGSSVSHTTETSTTSTTEKEWSAGAIAMLGNTFGVVINETGVIFNVRTETGGMKHEIHSNEETKMASFTYTLEDTDQGDAHSVDVLSSPCYGPIFHTRGGQTSNPYEPADSTKYYQPGTEISASTMQIEKPKISADQTIITNVPSGSSASFTLNLTNESETGDDVIYRLMMVEESNFNGAVLKIDGMPLTDGRLIKINAGDMVHKTLLLSQGNPSILDYENIGIVLASTTQYDPTGVWEPITDTLRITAHFVPTSSDVDLAVSSTVINRETGDDLTLTMSGFDRNFYMLHGFRIEYMQEGSPDWTTLHEYVLNLPANQTTSTKEALPDLASVPFTQSLRSFNDGTYYFRAVSECLQNNKPVVKYSKEIKVVKDMARPVLLGLPNPSDGILTAGSDISVRFNENIRNGSLSKEINFLVTGALNDAVLAHDVGLALSGSETTARTAADIDLSSHDFSLSMWVYRQADGMLLRHGNGSNVLTLAFENDGKLVATVAGVRHESENAVPKNKWSFLVLNLGHTEDGIQMSAYVAYDSYTDPLFNNEAVKDNLSQGRLTIGGGMTGALSELTLWNKSIDCIQMIAEKDKAKAAGTEGLIGYWKMDEGHGLEAADAARSRTLLLETESWYLNNVNLAAHFDGTSMLAADMSQESVGEEESYAVEMWVKPDVLKRSTLFSSDDCKLALKMTASGKLEIVADGSTIATSGVLTKSTWHHVALNVLRGSSAILYVDGKNVQTMTEQSIPALQGTYLYVGTQRTKDETTTPATYSFEDYFEGDIDEIRVWNASLQGKFLSDNRYSRIDTASVKGLVLYYPFEHTGLDSYNQKVTEFRTENILRASTLGAQTAPLPTETNSAPGLKAAPSLSNLQYYFTASEREIFITLTDPAARLEGTTVYFTLRSVYDEHGNASDPIVWSAYVRRNPLAWESPEVNVIASAKETETFEVSFTNSGGTAQEWSLKGMPSWLTADVSQGTLDPLKTQTVRFTTQDGAPIGNYRESIYLVGNEAICEPLEIGLKVFGEVPSWAFDPSDYNNTANLTARLSIEGEACENPDTRVAAFIGEECVGIASPSYNSLRDTYYLCMTIYGSDSMAGKEVRFKVWDASTGVIYSSIYTSQQIFFNDGDIYGTFNSPVSLSTTEDIEQQILLNKGWNWASFYVTPVPNGVKDVMDGYASSISLVKDKNTFSASDGSEFEEGALKSLKGATHYMMYADKATTFLVSGTPVTPEEAVQTIHTNWTWIGNPVRSKMTLDKAFAGLNPELDDVVKSRTAFAIYNGYAWEGELKSIEPGMGYMYYTNGPAKTFTYPESGPAPHKRTADAAEALEEPSDFTVDDMSVYPGNMTVLAEVYVNGLKADDLELAAFAGEECRAVARASNGRYYITIPGEDRGQAIDICTYYMGRLYRLTPALDYVNDAMIGTLKEPLRLNLQITGLEGVLADAHYVMHNVLTTDEIKEELQYHIDQTQIFYDEIASKTPEEINSAILNLEYNIRSAQNSQGSHDVVDGTPYNYLKEVVVPLLTYTRTYTGDWQALYVPFSMNFTDLNGNFDVAYINGIRQYDNDNDGTIDETVMDVVLLTDGAEIKYNTPYLIRAHEPGEKSLHFSSAVLMPAEENSVTCSTTIATYTFTGTYQPMGGEVMKQKGYYALGRDDTTNAVCLVKSNGNPNNVLKSNRWYMHAQQRQDSRYLLPTGDAMVKIHVIGEDDPSDIREVTDDFFSAAKDVYDLSGRKVEQPVHGNVYIVDGMKVMYK